MPLRHRPGGGLGGPVDEILQKIAEHLRQGLQYPDVTFASITLDRKEYTSGPAPSGKVSSRFASDMSIGGKKRGRISISRVARIPQGRGRAYQGGGGSRVEGRGAAFEAPRAEAADGQNRRPRPGGMEARTRGALERAPTPLLVARLNGDIVKANAAFYRLLDYPADGSVGLNFVRDSLYEDPG